MHRDYGVGVKPARGRPGKEVIDSLIVKGIKGGKEIPKLKSIVCGQVVQWQIIS